MKYRRKPIAIEAFQFVDRGFEQMGAPEWFLEAVRNGLVMRPATSGLVDHSKLLLVRTIAGDQVADPGDWIIRGENGMISTCKPDIFAATYEAVEAAVVDLDRKFDAALPALAKPATRASLIDARLSALEEILELIGTHRHKLRSEFTAYAEELAPDYAEDVVTRAGERLDMLEYIEPMVGKCIDGLEFVLREAELAKAAQENVKPTPAEVDGIPAHIDIVDQNGLLRRVEMGPDKLYRIAPDADWFAKDRTFTPVDDKREPRGVERIEVHGIRLDIDLDDTGLYYGTSPDVPGLLLANADRETLINQVEGALAVFGQVCQNSAQPEDNA